VRALPPEMIHQKIVDNVKGAFGSLYSPYSSWRPY
jgi:hypothetical protein